MEALSCIDQCFIGDDMLERLPLPLRVRKSMVGGIDLNKPRLRHVAEADIALSASPDGFTASALADQARALGNRSPSAYGPRQAAYVPKKLRGKQIVRRIGSTRRYEPLPSGPRAITALLVLRDKAIKPLLAAAQEIAPNHGDKPRAPSIATTWTCDAPRRASFMNLGLQPDHRQIFCPASPLSAQPRPTASRN
jgi:hypothetical protein